jgi:hypothetical protein
VTEAVLVASVLSGLPSTVHAVASGRSLGAAAGQVLGATRAVGTLLPPGRAGLVRGAVVHGVVSAGVGEVLARTLPDRRRSAWGAAAGLVVGVVNVGIIGRAFPGIRALPLGPQIADNVAFGLVFALALGR